MVLPVYAARLCVDCDILTQAVRCPVCGRNRTVPLEAWVKPLRGVLLRDAETPTMIVWEDHYALYWSVRQRFEGKALVILDRRKGDRRGRSVAVETERRRADHRQPLTPGERERWAACGYRVVGGPLPTAGDVINANNEGRAAVVNR